MIQLTVACILLLVAYRNRRSFVQWIAAFHNSVQKIKPALPSLLKLPGSSRGNASDESSAVQQPSHRHQPAAGAEATTLDGTESTTRLENITSDASSRPIGTESPLQSSATDDENTPELTRSTFVPHELTEEELLEKLSDSDRDSGVSDDTMLHFSTSDDDIIWRGRVREVKSVFEAARTCDEGFHRSPKGLSAADTLHISSFLEDKDVKIIDSSGQDIDLPRRERPTFLSLCTRSKSSVDDMSSSEEKLSPADVVCWSGPYMEQEQEQQVLRQMSNPFLIKRRVTSKLDAVDRLEKRIQEQQERIHQLLEQIQEKRAAEDFVTSMDEYPEDEDETTREMNGTDGEEESAEDLELQLVEEKSILRQYQKNLHDTLQEIASLSAKIDWGSDGENDTRAERETESPLLVKNSSGDHGRNQLVENVTLH